MRAFLARKRHWFLLPAAMVAILCFDLLLPPPIERAQDQSVLVVDRDGHWLHAYTNADKRWRFPADLKKTDPLLLKRLVSIEDKRFWTHWGVDPLAVVRAVVSMVREGEVRSGASTITMQTARLLEPRPRTLGSKLIETLRAFQIERRLSKSEILELYLTLAPYGGNLEGVRSASLSYFGKEPHRLTDAEQALLIALPQAPESRRPDLHVERARKSRNGVIDAFVRLGEISDQMAEEAMLAPMPTARMEYPRMAHHASRRLAEQGAEPVVHATIDHSIQTQAETILRRHVSRFSDDATAALLIVDNETNAVLASIGSSGTDKPGGWFDLTQAIRSPGSTLKPFVYAKAFDDGLLSARTVVDDMPRSFGGYRPENFDRVFRGQVLVKEALQHSLNMPAVAALNDVGVMRFWNVLRGAGVELKVPDQELKAPSLAVALGGAGIKATELATLYAGLAKGGNIRPLRWTVDETEDRSTEMMIMTPATADRITAILAKSPSLTGRNPYWLSKDAPEIAFKTGTSYGHRDAWAAGFSGEATVIVWVGRADGAPRPGETGRKTAAPLLFEIFDMLARIQQSEVKSRSLGLIAQDEEGVRQTSKSLQFTTPPQITFPANGVELFLDPQQPTKSFTFAARGGSGDGYSWYVNNEYMDAEDYTNRVAWTPEREGFYEVTVVDQGGRSDTSTVRVMKVQ